MRWRVEFWIFTGYWREHNWVGPGGKKKLKRLDPPRRVAEFATQAKAEGLRQKLRERYGDDVIAQVIAPGIPQARRKEPSRRRSQGRRLIPMKPMQMGFARDWPIQRPPEAAQDNAPSALEDDR
jgi:hypothetical protein